MTDNAEDVHVIRLTIPVHLCTGDMDLSSEDFMMLAVDSSARYTVLLKLHSASCGPRREDSGKIELVHIKWFRVGSPREYQK